MKIVECAKWAREKVLVAESLEVACIITSLALGGLRFAWRAALRSDSIDLFKQVVKKLLPRIEKVAEGKARQVSVTVLGKAQSGPSNFESELNPGPIIADAMKQGLLVFYNSREGCERLEVYAA